MKKPICIFLISVGLMSSLVCNGQSQKEIPQIAKESLKAPAAGGYFSIKGIGVSVSIPMPEGNFSRITLASDMEDVLTGNTDVPGVKATYCFNYCFVQADGIDNLVVYFAAGPGITAGYLRDKDNSRGPVFGINGSITAAFVFDKKAIISFGWSADAAMHMRKRTGADNNVIHFYRNGLYRAFYPELRIMYYFK